MSEDSTVTGRAYAQLRADLISCRLPPSSRLNVSHLCREFGFSQAAVREALSRLTSEGLVETERHAGFRAAPTSMTGFRELSAACATVELHCLRSALQNGDVLWEGKLLATYHVASRTLKNVVRGDEDLVQYVRYRQVFHETLLLPCSNQWLLWSWRLLYAQHMRYRHMFASLARFESELAGDFPIFMNAVLDRDIAAAERMWMEHYEKISRFAESSVAERDATTTSAVDKRQAPRPVKLAAKAAKRKSNRRSTK
jgi:DNA-binding GntR family transcriptional regulator